MGCQFSQLNQIGIRYRFAAKVPDYCADFGISVEGQCLVNSPEFAIPVNQNVVCLSVGIVGHQVEASDHPQLIRIRLAQGVIVHSGIVFDILLH